MGEIADYYLEGPWYDEDRWDLEDWDAYYMRNTPGLARPPLKLAEPEDFPLV